MHLAATCACTAAASVPLAARLCGRAKTLYHPSHRFTNPPKHTPTHQTHTCTTVRSAASSACSCAAPAPKAASCVPQVQRTAPPQTPTHTPCAPPPSSACSCAISGPRAVAQVRYDAHPSNSYAGINPPHLALRRQVSLQLRHLCAASGELCFGGVQRLACSLWRGRCVEWEFGKRSAHLNLHAW